MTSLFSTIASPTGPGVPTPVITDGLPAVLRTTTLTQTTSQTLGQRRALRGVSTRPLVVIAGTVGLDRGQWAGGRRYQKPAVVQRGARTSDGLSGGGLPVAPHHHGPEKKQSPYHQRRDARLPANPPGWPRPPGEPALWDRMRPVPFPGVVARAVWPSGELPEGGRIDDWSGASWGAKHPFSGQWTFVQQSATDCSEVDTGRAPKPGVNKVKRPCTC